MLAHGVWMELTKFQLAPDMLAAVHQIAPDEDSTVGAVICDAIKRDLYRRTRAKTARGADERLVAPLRALLADDLVYATRWDDLQARLMRTYAKSLTLAIATAA